MLPLLTGLERILVCSRLESREGEDLSHPGGKSLPVVSMGSLHDHQLGGT